MLVLYKARLLNETWLAKLNTLERSRYVLKLLMCVEIVVLVLFWLLITIYDLSLSRLEYNVVKNLIYGMYDASHLF